MAPTQPAVSIFDRMERAVTNVKERLARAVRALNDAGVDYAVIGGNAVAAWVATVDEAGVRNTRDVDLLLRRDTFDDAARALEAAGFVRRHAAGIDLFLDGPNGKARDALHVVFAGERVRPDYALPAPDTSESIPFADGARILDLPALTRMKLTSYRWRDRVHLQDLAGVGLLGEGLAASLPPELARRLREVIENPDA